MTDSWTEAVPGWVYRPDLRAPGTDDEPWTEPFHEAPARHRIALCVCLLALIAIVILRPRS